MSPLLALLVLAALVAAATGAGLLWRARAGRVRERHGEQRVSEAELGPQVRFGRRGTVVLLTTPSCALCPGARRTIRSELAGREGIASAEVDLSERLDLARRLHVFRTPTTLVLDPRGRIAARAEGGLDPLGLRSRLDALATTS